MLSHPCAETFLARRLDGLQRTLQAAGAGGPRPYVLIENSSKCNTNASGDKVLPNGTVWLSALVQKVRSLSWFGWHAKQCRPLLSGLLRVAKVPA